MRKIILIFGLLFPITAFGFTFDDGLSAPDSILEYELDELQTGAAKAEIFNVDIDGDKIPDRITRITHSNISAYSYYEYELELDRNGVFVSIGTFRTIDGAETSLQKVQFVFSPQFNIIVISRPFKDFFYTPTQAVKNVYELGASGLIMARTEQLSETDNVAELF